MWPSAAWAVMFRRQWRIEAHYNGAAGVLSARLCRIAHRLRICAEEFCFSKTHGCIRKEIRLQDKPQIRHRTVLQKGRRLYRNGRLVFSAFRRIFQTKAARIFYPRRFCFAGFSRRKNYSSKIPAFSLFVIFSGGRKSTPADTNFTLPSGMAMK